MYKFSPIHLGTLTKVIIYLFLLIHIIYPPYNFNVYGKSLDFILQSSDWIMVGFIWIPFILSFWILWNIKMDRWIAGFYLIFFAYYTFSLTISNLDTYRFNPSIQLPYSLLMFSVGIYLYQISAKKIYIYLFMLLVGLYEAIDGIVQHHIWRWTKPDLREQFEWILPPIKAYLHDGTAFHHDILRAPGTLIDPNNLGLFLVITGMLSLFLYLETFRSKMKLFLVIISHLLICVGIYYTYSRASWLGTLLGLAILSYTFFKNTSLKMKIILPILLAAFLTLESQTLNQRADSVDTETGSVASRISVWQSSLIMFLDYPWYGIGAGNFRDAFEPYKPNESSRSWSNCMNSHLLLLVELGLLGALFYVLLMMLILFHIMKNKKQNRFFGLAFVIAVGVNGIFTHILNIPPSSLLWWFGLGTVYSHYSYSTNCDSEKA